MRAIFEHGLNVPKDISVIGYSNSFIASQVYPRLTTIDQAGYRFGQMAADKIIHMIEKGTLTGEVHIVEPELVIRDSCRAIGRA
jgi:LacI family transcriptional regulator